MYPIIVLMCAPPRVVIGFRERAWKDASFSGMSPVVWIAESAACALEQRPDFVLPKVAA
jgi:hypothetical protein